MLKEAKKLAARYKELENLLCTSEVLSNSVLYQRYSKEFAELAPIYNIYRELCNLNSEYKSTNALFATETDEEIKSLAMSELEDLKKRIESKKVELSGLLTSKEESLNKSVVLEIRAGTGGLEASLFAADLFRMYTKYAQSKGFSVEFISLNETELGGYKEIIFSIEGSGAYEKFKYESGIHRVQRVPQTESSGRIHTSAVSVAVLPQPDDLDVEVDPKDLRIDVYRSTGHGGQSVNTTDSAVRITHVPTNLVVTCQDERSQLKNKQKAMKVLRARLYDEKIKRQEKKISSQRKAMVGTGDRSEKIRTYNFVERRVTDHRINLTLYKLDEILVGNIDMIVNELWKKARENMTGREDDTSDE